MQVGHRDHARIAAGGDTRPGSGGGVTSPPRRKRGPGSHDARLRQAPQDGVGGVSSWSCRQGSVCRGRHAEHAPENARVVRVAGESVVGRNLLDPHIRFAKRRQTRKKAQLQMMLRQRPAGHLPKDATRWLIRRRWRLKRNAASQSPGSKRFVAEIQTGNRPPAHGPQTRGDWRRNEHTTATNELANTTGRPAKGVLPANQAVANPAEDSLNLSRWFRVTSFQPDHAVGRFRSPFLMIPACSIRGAASCRTSHIAAPHGREQLDDRRNIRLR